MRMRPATRWVASGLLAFTLASAGAATFDSAAQTVVEDLRSAQEELTGLNRRIAAEKPPLSRRVTELEATVATRTRELESIRKDAHAATDGRSGLEAELKAADQELEFAASSLAEFGHFLATRIHVSELRRHADGIEAAEAAEDDASLSPRERLERQLRLLDMAANHVVAVVGGQTFDGQALSADGTLIDGRFALAGPVAVFVGAKEKEVGIAQLEVNALDPVVRPLTGALTNGVSELVAAGRGSLPVDASGGRALQVEERRETLPEHLRRGGVVMIPILGLATLAALLVLAKWIQIGRLKAPGPDDVELILQRLAAGRKDQALEHARTFAGPAGQLLQTAIDNASQKKELLEELLYERVLHIRPRLERWLAFVALTAAVAPLLGLLGTVTGMINTFKLITLFGTGDAKTLSSGISEALITTEWGLIVAVSALLAHTFLSRRIRGFITSLEQVAVGFVNGLTLDPDE